MPNTTGYNASDPLQQSFLSALALGETGNNGGAYTGVGGTDLSASATDQYGFPTWGGVGNSHAAGTYQFEPGTWDQIAAQYNLNFGNSSDQSAGAWYYAQQVYSQKTGGSLEQALQSGDYTSIQTALGSAWPSVNGNGANPQGLAYDLANGIGASSNSAGGTAAPSSSSSTSSGGIWDTIVNLFQRTGLMIIGGIILFVALWYLLARNDIVPSPADVVSAAKEAGAAAA